MIFAAEDFVAKNPRPTPLYTAAASSSEANVWTSINGWSVARVYASVEKEYAAAKSGAALVDLGPLARYSIRGRDAAQFLSRVTTAPAEKLEPGGSARGLILDADGAVVDLAEVSRLSTELFLMTTPTEHARRLQLAARGHDVIADDISEDVAALGVFGPEANDVLAAAGLKAPSDSIAASAVLRGVETAARPIQFGAVAGVELIFPMAEALTVWERIIRRSGITPIGLDAMEILRLESGAPRSGVDFISAERASEGNRRLPIEIGLAHLAPLDRGWFNGRRQLRHARDGGHRLVTLAINDERSMPGAAVYQGGKSVGRITSCAWSPATKQVLAFADVSSASNGKDYEISSPSPSGERVAATLAPTAESALSKTYLNALESATDSGRRRV